MTLAHIAGLPLEETLLALAPAGVLLATALAAAVRERARRLRLRRRRGPTPPRAG